MEVINFVYLFFILLFFLPRIRQMITSQLRLLQIRRLQKQRSSRVISLVHRQSLPGILGMLTGGFISIEDSEQILRAIRSTDKDKPIDMIVHTPGGLVLATDQIAQALAKHPAKVTLFVPHYAMSGGTMLGLASDEIVMDENAVLGRVDPQVYGMPAVSIQNAVKRKSKDEINDRMLVLDDLSEKALAQNKKSIKELLKTNGYDGQTINNILEELASGKYTHDHPITFNEAKELGLKVSSDVPKDVYRFIQLFPQQRTQQSAVQYLPPTDDFIGKEDWRYKLKKMRR